MYAKLRFNSSCTNAQRNLSLVKLITDYYDPPASVSFDGYPGLDSNFCEVISTDSSHWTFAGVGDAQSLGSDSIGYSSGNAWHGSQYTLKTTYDTGHTQYADVKVMGNAENANIYNGSRVGTMIVPRNRFGTSIENRQCGNNTITSDTDDDLRGQGITHYVNKEIHIFADQTKLCLLGSQYNDVNHFVFNGLYQFEQPNYFKYYDKLNSIADSNVPCVWNLTGVGHAGAGNNMAQENTTGWSSNWDNNTTHGPIIQFPGNIYNAKDGKKFRNISLNANVSNDFAFSTPSTTVDDDTTQEPAVVASALDGFNYGFTTYTQAAGYNLQGFRYMDWPCNRESVDFRQHSTNVYNIHYFNMSFGNARVLDSDGNKTLSLYPTIMDWATMGGNIIDMSKKAGVYFAPGGAGFWGDSAEVDGTKYQYFPISAHGAFAIRRD